VGNKVEFSPSRHPGERRDPESLQLPWIPDQVRDDKLYLGYVGLQKNG